MEGLQKPGKATGRQKANCCIFITGFFNRYLNSQLINLGGCSSMPAMQSLKWQKFRLPVRGVLYFIKAFNLHLRASLLQLLTINRLRYWKLQPNNAQRFCISVVGGWWLGSSALPPLCFRLTIPGHQSCLQPRLHPAQLHTPRSHSDQCRLQQDGQQVYTACSTLVCSSERGSRCLREPIACVDPTT